MEVDSSGSIPVQAVLRLVVDKMGQSGVEDALKKQEQSFSGIENTVGRIGTGMEGVARTVADLAGVAGVGALLDKFVKVETSASNVALAMGKVTGGPGAYHAIGQEMLGVQSRTGVTVGESESALRSLAASVGLSPRAGQAGMLAEVIAGYSKVTGMPSSTLGAILGPMLQAEGRGATSSASAYTLGEARANLTAFPGSQIEGMLPVVSNLTTSAALGTPGGSGKGVSVGGISSLINAISGPGSVLRQPGVAEQAAQGIGGTLQGAYQNPRVYGFLKMAGISFKESQLGFNDPATMEKIVREANRQYPGSTETDWKMRRLLYLELGQGEAGADALERIESATHGGTKPLHVATPRVKKEGAEAHHAQTLTTPQAQLSKLAGKVEGFAFGSIGGAGISLLGAAFGLKGLNALPGALFKGAKGLLGAGPSIAGDAFSLGDLGLSALTAVPDALFNTNPLGVFGVKNPTGGPLAGNVTGSSRKAIEDRANAKAVEGVAAAAQKKFGSGWNTGAGRKWMEKELNNPKSHFDQETSVGIGESQTSMHPWAATHLLQQALNSTGTAGGGGGEGQQFSEAVKKFSEAVAKMTGTHSTSYGGGAAMHNASFMGAPAVAAMDASTPGIVMASFLGKGGTTPGTTPMGGSPSGGPHMTYADFMTPGGAGRSPLSSGVTHWRSAIEAASRATGVPADVIGAVMQQESGGNAGAVSGAGAKGLMQLMNPSGLGVRNWQNGPENIMGGARELQGDLKAFGGNIPKALAAYNAGIGAVQKAGGVPNIPETEQYVKRIEAMLKQMNINVNVNVGGAKVEQHKAKVGGQLV